MDPSEAMIQLRHVMIHEVMLLEHQSSFPVQLEVHPCGPAREYMELGEAYTAL